MIALLRRLRWLWKCNKGHRNHAKIANTWIENVSLVDPSAAINNSRIYGSISVGRNCVLDDCHIKAHQIVSVGDYSIFSGPVRIVADLNPIKIGKFCSLAPHVAIWESLHDYGKMTTYALFASFFGEDFRKDITSKGSVQIGNDVWVGTHSIVLSGVTIGDGAVIGAGSVVSKDIPPYTIAAGVPAVPVRPRFAEEVIRGLQELRWWDWSDEIIRKNRFLFEREPTVELIAAAKV
jgi:acetyltransferase-like isoleucine patch superfamily enzyme